MHYSLYLTTASRSQITWLNMNGTMSPTHLVQLRFQVRYAGRGPFHRVALRRIDIRTVPQ